MVYGTAVLIALTALAGVFIVASSWVTRNTDDSDVSH
jgi:hypothetical protein